MSKARIFLILTISFFLRPTATFASDYSYYHDNDEPVLYKEIREILRTYRRRNAEAPNGNIICNNNTNLRCICFQHSSAKPSTYGTTSTDRDCRSLITQRNLSVIRIDILEYSIEGKSASGVEEQETVFKRAIAVLVNKFCQNAAHECAGIALPIHFDSVILIEVEAAKNERKTKLVTSIYFATLKSRKETSLNQSSTVDPDLVLDILSNQKRQLQRLLGSYAILELTTDFISSNAPNELLSFFLKPSVTGIAIMIGVALLILVYAITIVKAIIDRKAIKLRNEARAAKKLSNEASPGDNRNNRAAPAVALKSLSKHSLKSLTDQVDLESNNRANGIFATTKSKGKVARKPTADGASSGSANSSTYSFERLRQQNSVDSKHKRKQSKGVSISSNTSGEEFGLVSQKQKTPSKNKVIPKADINQNQSPGSSSEEKIVLKDKQQKYADYGAGGETADPWGGKQATVATGNADWPGGEVPPPSEFSPNWNNADFNAAVVPTAPAGEGFEDAFISSSMENSNLELNIYFNEDDADLPPISTPPEYPPPELDEIFTEYEWETELQEPVPASEPPEYPPPDLPEGIEPPDNEEFVTVEQHEQRLDFEAAAGPINIHLQAHASNIISGDVDDPTVPYLSSSLNATGWANDKSKSEEESRNEEAEDLISSKANALVGPSIHLVPPESGATDQASSASNNSSSSQSSVEAVMANEAAERDTSNLMHVEYKQLAGSQVSLNSIEDDIK